MTHALLRILTVASYVLAATIPVYAFHHVREVAQADDCAFNTSIVTRLGAHLFCIGE